ncbi:MAG: LuxR C-terminal-related transcriptional regulator, partial [Chloroherpetonaceae bacterium]|nr:LuxR C-terminal-related transcriptional regulator [Chloroherpetonaceae bacterium]
AKKKELTEKERENFSKSISMLNPDFSKRLLARCASLTPAEVKVAEMARANLRTKDIASLMRVSVRTIETHRDHLRKKLRLKKGQSLATFLQTI